MASNLDHVLAGNAHYVETQWDTADAELPGKPRRGLAVLACMDTRFAVENVLGLKHGDAKIIRNAGNVLDDGALRSLVVAVHVMGCRDIVVLGHTKCGMTGLNPDVAADIANATGHTDSDALLEWLCGFPDPAEHIRSTVDKVRKHKLLVEGLNVHGLLYDNDTGKVSVVESA